MEPNKVIYVKEKALVPPVGPDITFEGYSDRKDTDVKYIRADIAEPSLEVMDTKIGLAAYAIVCKMIDWHLVESEPEGIDIEYEIRQILKDKFGC